VVLNGDASSLAFDPAFAEHYGGSFTYVWPRSFSTIVPEPDFTGTTGVSSRKDPHRTIPGT
jgi:hypothetical protein